MSTDYNKWRKFDDDTYVAKLEEQQDFEGVFSANYGKQQEQTRDILETSTKLQRRIELLESKRAVEILKAAGRQNRNRKNQIPKSLEIGALELAAGSSFDVDVSNSTESSEESIRRFVEILSNLASDVNKLQALTEKRRLHRKGFQSSLSALNGVEQLLKLLPYVFHRNLCDEKEKEDIRDSIETLMRQIFACQSLFAMSGGYFAISVDLTRILLATDAYRNEAGFWIIRALSFAGMGSSYLCYLHLKTAQCHSPFYPGLETCISFFESDVQHQIGRENNGGMVRNSFEYSKTVEKEILRAVYLSFHLQDNEEWLKNNPEVSMVNLTDVQLLLDADQCFSKKLQSLSLEFPVDFIRGNSLIQWLGMDIVVSKKKRLMVQQYFSQALSLWGLSGEETNLNSTLFISLFLAHKLWSEAHLLYLEGLFASAEGKYVTAVTLLSEIINILLASSNSSIYETVNGVLSILLLNIGLCRSHRHKKYSSVTSIEERSMIFDLPLPERLQYLERLSLIGIFRLSFSLTRNPICLWKEIEALEDDYRFEEALDVVVTLRTLLEEETWKGKFQHSSVYDSANSRSSLQSNVNDERNNNRVCVVSLGNSSFLSQVYLMGKKRYLSLDYCTIPTTASPDHESNATESGSLTLHLSVLLSPHHFWGSLENSESGLDSKPCGLSGSFSIWRNLLQSKEEYLLYLKKKLGL